MDTIKINKKNTLMVAHRGSSRIERENTNAAFLVAGVKSYYGIETDVHVTKDGKIIVCHDDNILRVTGVDMVIEDSMYEDLIKQKILDFDSTTRSDLVFPTLEDYLRICMKYEKHGFLELKNKMDEKYIYDIVDKVIELDYFDNITFISFFAENLIHIRNKYKDAKIQFLCCEFNDDILNMLLRYRFGLDIHFEAVTKELIDKLHSYGIDVNCWTVNIDHIAEKLVNYGIDMITSDILE